MTDQDTVIRYPAIRQVKAWDTLAPLAPVHPRNRILPGTGAVKDEECGEWTALAVCSADVNHERRPIMKSCNRLECPVCHTRVLQRNSAAVASRVDGYRKALTGQVTLYGGIAKKPRPPRHGILSPPASVVNAVYDRTMKSLAKKYPGGEYTAEDIQATYMEKFRYEAYKALELLGIDGAACIIHYDRVTEEGKEKHQAEAPGMARWEWLRCQVENWHDLVYFSPHMHVAYYGWTMDTDEFYEKSGGWVFKMRRVVEEVAPLAYYLLSHAPVIHGRLSVTYTGCLSPRKLKAVDDHIEKEEVLCEKCGAVMVFAAIDMDGNITHITDRPLYHKRRVRTYRIEEGPGPGPGPGPGGEA